MTRTSLVGGMKERQRPGLNLHTAGQYVYQINELG